MPAFLPASGPFVVASAHSPTALPDDEVLESAEYLGKPTRAAVTLLAVEGLLGREVR